MNTRFVKWSSEIQRTRVARLRDVLERRFAGNRAHLARAIGRQPTQLISLLESRRGFGEQLARDIEARLNLPLGWLDSELVLDATLAPPEVRDRIRELTELAVTGAISWATFEAAIAGAIAIARTLPPRRD